MKEIKFVILNRIFSFRIPVLQSQTKSSIYAKLLYILSIGSLLIFALLLPLSILFNPESEPATFNIFIIFIILTTIFSGSLLLFLGKKISTDPKYFLTLLFFALITTSASVLKSPSHISGTIGIDTFKALAGISVMAIIGYYYFSNLLIKDRVLFNRFLNFIDFGIISLIVLSILHTLLNDGKSPIVDNLEYFLVLFAWLFISLIRKTEWLKRGVAYLIGLLILIIGVSFESQIQIQFILRFVFVLLITIVVSVFLYFNQNKSKVKNQFKEIKSSLKERKLKIYNVKLLIFLILPLVLFILLIVVFAKSNYNSNTLLQPLEENINELVRLSRSSLSVILTGNGSYNFTSLSSNLNQYSSFVQNIIKTQGLLGITAYTFIITSALYLSILTYKKDRTVKALSLFISQLFLTLLLFIAYPGFIGVLLWWTNFILTTIYFAFIGKEISNVFILKDWFIESLIKRNRIVGILIKVLIHLLILSFGIYTIVALTNVVT